MSATKRGAARRADDYYATPAWATEALVHWMIRSYRGNNPLILPGDVLDPFAGSARTAGGADAMKHLLVAALDNRPVPGVPRCPVCLTRPRWRVTPRWDGTLPLPAPGESGDARIACPRCGRGANGPRVYIWPRMPLNHRRNMLRLQALRWTWRVLRDRPEWAERGGETVRKELQRCGSAGGTSC